MAHHTRMALSTTPKTQQGVSVLSVLLFVCGLTALIFSWYWYTNTQPAEVEALTREGVIAEVKTLNQLQTVGFSVDTVITSQKQGNWYNLWQDEQKGLFVAHGEVRAGIDLSKLTPEQVQVSQRPIAKAPSQDNTQRNIVSEIVSDFIPETATIQTMQVIVITIPKAEIFNVYLDDIEVYDLQTGLFGMLKTDPAIFEKAQVVGKQQVLKTACKGDILKIATENAQKQVEALFRLTGFDVTVNTQQPEQCSVE